MMLPVYHALAQSKLMRDLERAFRDATGLTLKLVRSGEPQQRVAAGGEENAFCALMARSTSSCAACMEVQRDLERRLSRERASQETCCFAGLTELAVPVFVGDQHVATLLGGQVFRRRPQRRQFDRLIRQLNQWGSQLDLKRVRQAYSRTPVVSEKQFRGAMALLEFIAGQLAELAQRQLLAANGDDPLPVKQAKEFIRTHARGPVSLRQIIEHVHLSRRYFCKMFKSATGMTYTGFVARVRVENAKHLLANSRLRMSEVAEGAGFNSISQFNRVFRGHSGTSPTAYRAQLAAQLPSQ